jgi:hypothetical protein
VKYKTVEQLAFQLQHELNVAPTYRYYAIIWGDEKFFLDQEIQHACGLWITYGNGTINCQNAEKALKWTKDSEKLTPIYLVGSDYDVTPNYTPSYEIILKYADVLAIIPINEEEM